MRHNARLAQTTNDTGKNNPKSMETVISKNRNLKRDPKQMAVDIRNLFHVEYKRQFLFLDLFRAPAFRNAVCSYVGE